MSRSYRLCRVVNGHIVDADAPEAKGAVAVDFKDYKHGRKSRWLQRDLASAESLGRVSTRIAARMSRRQPAA